MMQQYDSNQVRLVSSDPAASLCELVERRCGVRIPKVDIEALFMAEWEKLSILAHAIHHAQQRKQMADAQGPQQRGIY